MELMQQHSFKLMPGTNVRSKMKPEFNTLQEKIEEQTTGIREKYAERKVLEVRDFNFDWSWAERMMRRWTAAKSEGLLEQNTLKQWAKGMKLEKLYGAPVDKLKQDAMLI